ncbi:hypothetical protein PENTCL1PPCAC_23395, partial [Pristionchus entomophagus]
LQIRMPPPRAKRSRQSGEETNVARDDSEPTSSRRTRSSRTTQPVGLSVNEANSPTDVTDSTSSRRITRARRALGSGRSPSSSARTRPFGARTTAATQTEDHVGTDDPTAQSADGETSSARTRRFQRSSSVVSMMGSATTPDLSTSSPDSIEVDPEEEQPVEVDVEADPPRSRRAATQRALELLAAQQPQRAVRPTRAAAVRAREAVAREFTGGDRTPSVIRPDWTSMDGGGPTPIDLQGILDDIASNFTPAFFGQLLSEGATGTPPTRTFRFQRDAGNGRLALVRTRDLAGSLSTMRPTSSTSTNDADGGGAVAAETGDEGVGEGGGAVTMMRLDLQIDVQSMVRAGDAQQSEVERLLGDMETEGGNVIDYGREEMRRMAPQAVETQTRVRLDELSATEVHRVVTRVLNDAELSRWRVQRHRSRRERAAATAAAAAGTASPAPSSSTPREAPPPSSTLARAEAAAAAAEDYSTETSARVAALEAAVGELQAATAGLVAAAASLAREGQRSRRVPFTDAAAAATEATSNSAGTSAGDSSSSSSLPSGPSIDPFALTTQRILADIRTRIVSELREMRRDRDGRAASSSTSTSSAAAADTTTRPANEGRSEASGDGFLPPFPMSPIFISGRPSEDAPITTERLRDFILHISSAIHNDANEPFGGVETNARIRSIVEACTDAVASLGSQQDVDNVLAVLLRAMVDNVNTVEPRDMRVGRDGRRRVITFHMRPITGLVRGVFSDLLSEGRGEDPGEQRLREQEDAEDAEESTFKSSEWGECRICMADEPSNPVGCKFCRQLVGCNKCCNRWHRAGRRPTSSIIDTLFASFRADRERFERIDEQRRTAAASGEAAAPPTLAASAAAAAARDAPPPERSVSSSLRNSLMSEAWESNCPLCRKTWRTKPQVVPMQRCLPLGEPLAEEDRAPEEGGVMEQ